MNGLRKFLDQLKQIPEEIPIEPELKADKKDKDRKIREEQDLQAGIVLEVTVEPGEGGDSPQDGDLIYVHYSIHSHEDDLLYSTWADEGGSGQPLAFIVGKGNWRAPRSWELAVLSMTRNQRKRLKVQPSYSYQHSDCKMSPPAAVAGHVKEVLHFDLKLTNWYPKVRACGESGDVFKRVLVESEKWEVARPPNEVTFSIEARTPAYDGTQLSGFKYYNTSPDKPLRLQLGQLGQAQLPQALETALCHMCKGEKAVFVVPAQQMHSSSGQASALEQQQNGGEVRQQEGDVLIPHPPSKAVQVELCVQLHDLVQVRDMTGDGRVLKKRIKEGTGDFPVDCPLHDTRVRCHYRVRQLTNPTNPGPWVLDTTQQGLALGHSGTNTEGDPHTEPRDKLSTSGNSSGSDGDSWPDLGGAVGGGAVSAVEVDTGCGELPEGLEMCLKLMVPDEVASVVCQPKYAYQGRSDLPAGIDASQPVEFQCVLLGFEREGYWQHMSWDDRWRLAENIKEKGKLLYQQQKYAYANNRYTYLLRLIESTRDFEEQEQIDKADAYKATLLSNLALVTFHQEEYARCVEWCDKALQEDPENAKVMFRKGKALSMKGDYDDAEEALTAAAEMDSGIEADVKAALAANKQRAKAAAAKQKQQFSNFFGKS